MQLFTNVGSIRTFSACLRLELARAFDQGVGDRLAGGGMRPVFPGCWMIRGDMTLPNPRMAAMISWPQEFLDNIVCSDHSRRGFGAMTCVHEHRDHRGRRSFGSNFFVAVSAKHGRTIMTASERVI
jgi:hypothetical protein